MIDLKAIEARLGAAENYVCLECGGLPGEADGDCINCVARLNELYGGPVGYDLAALVKWARSAESELRLFVRKGRFHMERWPDDKEMRAGIERVYALLAQLKGDER